LKGKTYKVRVDFSLLAVLLFSAVRSLDFQKNFLVASEKRFIDFVGLWVDLEVFQGLFFLYLSCPLIAWLFERPFYACYKLQI
jgi:hypothetical protein